MQSHSRPGDSCGDPELPSQPQRPASLSGHQPRASDPISFPAQTQTADSAWPGLTLSCRVTVLRVLKDGSSQTLSSSSAAWAGEQPGSPAHRSRGFSRDLHSRRRPLPLLLPLAPCDTLLSVCGTTMAQVLEELPTHSRCSINRHQWEECHTACVSSIKNDIERVHSCAPPPVDAVTSH